MKTFLKAAAVISAIISVFSCGSRTTTSTETIFTNNEDLDIRDPFIVTVGDKYYMYCTEGPITFSDSMKRFIAYVGDDLQKWEGPYTLFENDGTFWADQKYWAPAVFVKDGTYYLYGSLDGQSEENIQIQMFKSDNPLGPFTPSESTMTTKEVSCIDPEIYVDNGKTYMIYSHGTDGFHYGELNESMDGFVEEPTKMFDLHNSIWEGGNRELNDGAAILKDDDGTLYCFFSSMEPGTDNYNMGYAVSDNGHLDGNWTIADKRMLSGTTGGHNMFFRSLDGKLMTAFHSPNFPGRPTFRYVKIENGEVEFTDTAE